MLFAIVTAIGMLALTGCGSDESKVGRISVNFVTAMFHCNDAGVKANASPESVSAYQGLKSFISTNPANGKGIASLVDMNIQGNHALVKVNFQRPPDKDLLVTVPLEKKDGKWIVTWTKTSGSME